jgi:hypothetical protein
MRFLLKLGFWLGLVLLIIPIGPGPEGSRNTVDATEAYTAARETLGDLGQFCKRQPDVCRTGRTALHTAGIRATEGARIAYEFLDKRFGTPDAAPDQIETGTVKND